MDNFPLISVVVATSLAYLPVFRRASLQMQHNVFDNWNPRAPKAGALPKDIEVKIQKLHACHNNQLETLGVYAAGVAAATAVGVPKQALTPICMTYVVARVLYILAYTGEPKATGGFIRTTTFTAVLYAVFSVWIQAAKFAS